MANIVRISMRKEFEAVVIDDSIIEEEQSSSYQVYASCDQISTWIGSCCDIESLEEIASPENLINSIENSASEEELLILMPVLEHNNMKYVFFEESRTAIR